MFDRMIRCDALPWLGFLTMAFFAETSSVWGQNLEARLLAEPVSSLAAAAAESGDARRGAIVFHQAYLACVKCHSDQAAEQRIGPSLTKMEPKPSDEQLVDAVLRPSKITDSCINSSIL